MSVVNGFLFKMHAFARFWTFKSEMLAYFLFLSERGNSMINAKTAFSLLLSGTVACQLAIAPAFFLSVRAAASNRVSQAKDELGLNDVPDLAPIHTLIAPPLPQIKTVPAANSNSSKNAIASGTKANSGTKASSETTQTKQTKQVATSKKQSTTESAPAGDAGLQAGSQKSDVKANQSLVDAVRLEATVQKDMLKGSVESGDRVSPFLEGSVQTIPKGTKMEFTFTANVNSELSQKGDEVMMKVSANVPGGNGVAVPGGWFAHGFVTTAQGHKRMHRDGYLEIEFDKLISPDGHTEVDFPAKLSTKDDAMTSTLKQVAFGSKCTTVGAIGGAILSVQLTGIGGAVATHGISVGVGAAVGGGLGIIGALRRDGKADSRYEGDDVKLVISEPIMMPAFKADMLPSAKPVPVLKDMKISLNKFRFAKDPSGDTESRLLDIDITVDNHTKNSYSPRQLMVVDDHGHEFTPWVGENLKALMRKIGPEQSERIDILYEVNSGKRNYWLSLRETATGAELSRVPINCD
jgi:hypothetical protein